MTVVVAARNEEDHIEACIRSLLAQDEPTGGFEIIVADGMSTDRTREILERLQRDDDRLTVIDNPDYVTPSGFNAAIRRSRGRYIAFMGAHARYAPDYLMQCFTLAERLKADNVGGATMSEGRGYVQEAIAASHHSVFSAGGATWHSTQYEGRAGTVFGGFYRRDVFDRIGMFDEKLIRNQDDELNFRLELAGGLIWQSPTVRSWYTPRTTLKELFRQYQQYGYWKVVVMLKHGRTPAVRHYIPALFVSALLGSATLFAALAALSAMASESPFSTAATIALALFVLVLGSYVAVLVIASVSTALNSSLRLLPIFPLTFAAYHFGYGLGFLHGLLDFVVRRRKEPALRMSKLTR